MAPILKVKLGIIIFSVFILTAIPLIKSNFGATQTVKRWGELSWDDFKGIPRPFSSFGGAIFSNVYIEFDSVRNKYYAYAGQIDQRSWVKKETKKYPGALRHEQYHFNLTECFARAFNKYVDDNPNASSKDLNDELNEIKYQLSEEQSQYDDESDHGIIWGYQSKWEYKIDSMLYVSSGNKRNFVDYYSGASVFFAGKPEFKMERSSDFTISRVYIYKSYNMTLTMIAFQSSSINNMNLANYADQFVHKYDSLNVISFVYDSIGNSIKTCRIDLEDTTPSGRGYPYPCRLNFRIS